MSTSKWTSVITKEGSKLLSNIVNKNIVITKAVCGDTRFEGDLQELSTIYNAKPLELFSPQSIEGYLQFRLKLSNKNITTGFSLYQIGVYAKLAGEIDEVLFMVIQASENQPDIIPSNHESPNYVNDYVIRLTVGNSTNISVHVTEDAYVTAGMMNDVKTELKADVLNLQNTKLNASELNTANGAAGLDENKKLKQMPTTSDIGAVPITRTINNQALNSDITLTFDDVGAIAKTAIGQPNGIASLNGSGKLVQMPTAGDVGAIASTAKGQPNGVASLNASGKLVQMPIAEDFIETGTWKPLLNKSTWDWNGSCSSEGYYYKIGRLVYVMGRIKIIDQGNGGNAILNGLPFETDTKMCQQIDVTVSNGDNIYGGYNQHGVWLIDKRYGGGSLGRDGIHMIIAEAGRVYTISGFYLCKE